MPTPRKKYQIPVPSQNNRKLPLRTLQKPQLVFKDNRVCVHFTFCYHECTHFAWASRTYVEACGSHTLLGSVVQLYSHNVIQSVYTCAAFCCYQCTQFVWPGLLYNLTVPTHTRGAHTVYGSVVLLYIYTLFQSLFTLELCTYLYCEIVHSQVPAWPLFCKPITEEPQFTCFALIGSFRCPPFSPQLYCSILTQPFCPAEQAL